MLQLSLAILTTLTWSLVTHHTFHPRRCCCCLQCLCVSTHGVAHCRQELHATISSVVVSRYTRLDSFVVKHIARFLWTSNFEAVSIYPLTPHPRQLTHSTLSFFLSRAFSAPIILWVRKQLWADEEGYNWFSARSSIASCFHGEHRRRIQASKAFRSSCTIYWVSL